VARKLARGPSVLLSALARLAWLSDSSGSRRGGTSVHRSVDPKCCAKSTSARAIAPASAPKLRKYLRRAARVKVGGGHFFERGRSSAGLEISKTARPNRGHSPRRPPRLEKATLLLGFARREVLETAPGEMPVRSGRSFAGLGSTEESGAAPSSKSTDQFIFNATTRPRRPRRIRGGDDPAGAPAAGCWAAEIHAFAFATCPMVADGFGRSPGALRAIERGQIRSPARLTGARRRG
jgi:hypothetical protein